LKKQYLIISIIILFSFIIIILYEPSEEPRYKIIFCSAINAPRDSVDFQINPQKYFELYSMNLDGSNIVRITNNSFFEVQPEVSPDGKKILYSIHYSPGRVKEIDSGWEIAVMNIDGTNHKRLTNNNYLDFGAHWNHDGSKIVYVSDSAHRTNEDIQNNMLSKLDIYVMNVDGTDKRQLTEGRVGDVYADPSFSTTDTNKILFIHSRGLAGNFDLYVMDVDGDNKHLILQHSDDLLAINDPMFSPNDEFIIFEAKVRENRYGNRIYNIFIVNLDGSELMRITEDDGESDILPHISLDGKMICYYTYVFEDDGNTHKIRIANVDGSEEEIISIYPWESDLSWLP